MNAELLRELESAARRIDWFLDSNPDHVDSTLNVIRTDARAVIAKAAAAKAAAAKLQPVWTVLLLRPDYIADQYGEDTYMTGVEALSPEQAVRKAQGEAIAQDYNGPGQLREFVECHEREDYAALMVIRGRHEDVKP